MKRFSHQGAGLVHDGAAEVAGSFTYAGSSEVDQVDFGYGYIDA